MPISRLQWRALAALGALLLIICVWPLSCCIAVPLPNKIPTIPTIPTMSTMLPLKMNISTNNSLIFSDNSTYKNMLLSAAEQRDFTYKTNNQSTPIVVSVSPPARMLAARHGNVARILHLRRKRKKIGDDSFTTDIRVNSKHRRLHLKSREEHKLINKLPSETHLNGETQSIESSTPLPQYKKQRFDKNRLPPNKLYQFTDTPMATRTTATPLPKSITLENQFSDVFDRKINLVTLAPLSISQQTDISNTDQPSKTTISPSLFIQTAVLNQSVFSKSNSNGTTVVPITSVIAELSTLSRTERSVRPTGIRKRNSGLERNERSANLSHITGTARKIQLLIKNRLLQLLPDGTVSGTQDDGNDYTILQRGAVDVGQIRIQGVATCLFLCMDACGNVYGAKEFTNDCIFNETMLENYNIYSSSYHSNTQKTFYLALNKLGQPRKTHLPAAKPLGKLATYAKSFTFTVPEKRSEDLIGRLFGINHIKHGLKQLCDSGKSLVELTAKKLKPKGKCGKKMIRPLRRTGGGLMAGAANSANSSNGRKNGPKCANEQNCNKKKKNNHRGASAGSGSGSRLGITGGNGSRQPKQKLKKQQQQHLAQHHRKGGKKTKTKELHTTTRSTTQRPQIITTTDLVLPMTSTMIVDDDDLQNTDSSPSSTEHHEDDDEWDDTTVPSMGQTAFADDIDDGDEFDV